MKPRYLFPFWTKFLGLALIIIHMPAMLVWKMIYDDPHAPFPDSAVLFNPQHVFFILTSVTVTVGLFFVAFSKERVEDEQIIQLRLDSLHWAMYVNYLVLVSCAIFMTKSNYKEVLQFGLWFPLVFFIIRFRWVLYRLNRSLREEAK